MKKFLFPFSTWKYSFLETKWWHRALKIIFILIITITIVTKAIDIKKVEESIIREQNNKIFTSINYDYDLSNSTRTIIWDSYKIGYSEKQINDFVEIMKETGQEIMDDFNSDELDTIKQDLGIYDKLFLYKAYVELKKSWYNKTDIVGSYTPTYIKTLKDTYFKKTWKKVETPETPNKSNYILRLLKIYSRNIIKSIIIIYCISIGLQFIYYKWVIYIIYWNNNK